MDEIIELDWTHVWKYNGMVYFDLWQTARKLTLVIQFLWHKNNIDFN